MNTHPPELLDLCAGQALGALEPRDRQRLWDHLSIGCATCEPALESWTDAVASLAASLPPTRLRPALREQVMNDALATARSRPIEVEPGGLHVESHHATTLMPWMSWVLAFVALLLAGIAFGLWSDLRRTERDLADVRGLLARSTRQVADLAPWEALASAPGTRHAVLEGGLRGRVLHDPGTRRVLASVEGLAAGEHTLWASTPSGTVAVGPLRPDAGHARLRLARGPESITHAHAWLVSREAFASSGASPAGPVLARGQVR